jgi:transposase-like protein
MAMSQRLQVLLDEEEFAQIRRIARRHRLTVAEWVRQALRQARRDEPSSDPRRKLSAVREAARGAYPTADIEQMLRETEQGYLGAERS